ncbi:MAG: Mur ligase family protein, partial [bacterium]|nr:Mur ligase family protein [bacterium]
MLIKNLIYILQSENYDISRFLKYAYTHYCWWDLEKRQKIKWTSKAILLCIVSLILSIALLIITFLNLQIFAAMIIAVIIILSLPLIIALSLALILPIDIAAKKRILKKAKNILEKKRAENKLIVIGIAGSFGKTSAKEILYAILKEKFETVKTPENINTDLGVANFIIEKLGNEEIFIVEMGAHHRGDIQILCDLVRPDYSMLTGVGYSHLERFGSFDSLIEEKFVLPQNTRKISVLNADSDLINNYQNKLKLPGTKNVSKSMASE